MMGHFACVCSKKRQRVADVQDSSPPVNIEQDQRSYEPVLINAVGSSQPWLAEIRVNGSASILMKVDSGADVCCESVVYIATV